MVNAVRVLAVADVSAFPGIRRGLWPDTITVAAASAKSAQRMLHDIRPDLVLLDLALTQMDALQLLPRLLASSCAPVLALSSGPHAEQRAQWARTAGASDVVLCDAPFDESMRHALSVRIVAVVAAANARRNSKIPSLRAPTSVPFRPSLPAAARRPIAIIGASTGGTVALTELLRGLPANAPPVLVVQHMLPEFTSDFAERLDDVCSMHVHVAMDGEVLKPGHVLIAPGGKHLRIRRDSERLVRAVVTADAPIAKHRPSIDALFVACAEVLGSAAVAILLTGMGDDGARGLLTLRNVGARTIVQDQASSVCFGMPSAAIECGAAQEVLPLSQIARTLVELYQPDP